MFNLTRRAKLFGCKGQDRRSWHDPSFFFSVFHYFPQWRDFAVIHCCCKLYSDGSFSPDDRMEAASFLYLENVSRVDEDNVNRAHAICTALDARGTARFYSATSDT